MAKSATATVDAWVRKSKARMDAIVVGSTEDVIGLATRTQAGVDESGGSYKEGFIPKVTGVLSGSLVSSLNGAVSGEGEDNAISFVIGDMEAGDEAFFGWTAEYALAMHYGHGNVGGRLWVDIAVQSWQTIVAANIAAAKARVR